MRWNLDTDAESPWHDRVPRLTSAYAQAINLRCDPSPGRAHSASKEELGREQLMEINRDEVSIEGHVLELWDSVYSSHWRCDQTLFTVSL